MVKNNNVYSGIQVLSQEFSGRTFNLQVELMTCKLRFHDKHHTPCIPAAPSFDFVDFKMGRQAEQQLTSQSAAMLSECGFGATKAEGGHWHHQFWNTPKFVVQRCIYICIYIGILFEVMGMGLGFGYLWIHGQIESNGKM